MFVSSLTTEAVQRTNGLLRISEPYLKDWEGAYIDAEGNAISDKDGKYLEGKSEADRVANPAYCPAVKIVQTPTAEMFQAGQTAMQNVLTTNPDVKLVLAYASDGGSGASQAIKDEIAKGAGSVIKDPTKVAIFGVGVIGPEVGAILAASTGDGFLRGAVSFGGVPDPPPAPPALGAKTVALVTEDTERRGIRQGDLGRVGSCHGRRRRDGDRVHAAHRCADSHALPATTATAP